MFLSPMLLLVLFLLVPGGCNRQSPTTAPADASSDAGSGTENTVSVVATVYPLADIAMHVGGSHVSVDWLVRTGQNVAGFTPTDAQLRELGSANLIITSGIAEPWTQRMFSEQYRATHVIRPETTNAARAVFKAMHTAALPGAYWLDPLVARELIDAIRDRLIALDLPNAADYRRNADAYRAELDKLLVEYHISHNLIPAVLPATAPASTEKPATITMGWSDLMAGKTPGDSSDSAPPPRDPGVPAFISLGTFWFPLAQRAGWQEIAPVEKAPWQLDELDFSRLRKVAAEEKTTLLAARSDWPAGVRENLHDRTHLQLLLLDGFGTDGDGYLPMLRYNLQQLKENRPAGLRSPATAPALAP